MRMPQITETNWRALSPEADKPYLRIRGTRLGMRYKIADIPIADDGKGNDLYPQETAAIVRLVVVAPNLYLTLKNIVTRDNGDLPGDLLDEARALLTQIEGAQHGN